MRLTVVSALPIPVLVGCFGDLDRFHACGQRASETGCQGDAATDAGSGGDAGGNDATGSDAGPCTDCTVILWAAGDMGSIVRWDPVRQWQVSTPTAHAIYGLWASSASNAWAVGDQTVLHFDGNSWSPGTQGAVAVRLFAIWGAAPTDIWAVGSTRFSPFNPVVWHFDGTTWATAANVPPNPSGSVALNDVFGVSASDAWTVGDRGVIWHYNGAAWSDRGPAMPANTLLRVWGGASNDAWIVGDAGSLFRFNGQIWSAFMPSPVNDSLPGLWGIDAQDVWAVTAPAPSQALHWDGSGWSIQPSALSPYRMGALWAASGRHMGRRRSGHGPTLQRVGVATGRR